MPKTTGQKLVFTLITVILTVPCFVFYCSSYEAGGFTIEIIKNSWIFIPIEFILAYICAFFIGTPLALKLTFKTINPKDVHPFIVQTLIICSTVLIMCPLMSFLATILYDGIIAVGCNGAPMNNFIINFIPYWLQKVVLNFPFALLIELFLIQPCTRLIFKKIYKQKIKASSDAYFLYLFLDKYLYSLFFYNSL